jgi:hypothetical protein
MSLSTPTRQPWTVDEQKKLDDLLEAGKTVVEIAPPCFTGRAKPFMRECSEVTENGLNGPPAGRSQSEARK